MSDTFLRAARKDDMPALRALWKDAFGDSDEYLDAFFDVFGADTGCMLAETDGQPVSAAYYLKGPRLWPYRKKSLSSAYIYAVATLPAFRSRGVGSAVYAAACEAALASGAEMVCVLPASEGLYPFYQKDARTRVVSSVREFRLRRNELPEGGAAARIDVTRYGGLREGLLADEPHASLPESFYDWQEELCERSGGGLFVTGNGIAAAEMEDGVCNIRELLVPNNELAAVAAVARYCRADEYVVRAPAFWEGPGDVRRFVLGIPGAEPGFPLADDLWWGFAFD